MHRNLLNSATFAAFVTMAAGMAWAQTTSTSSVAAQPSTMAASSTIIPASTRPARMRRSGSVRARPGGAGADVFVLSVGGGRDVVTDFNPAEDILVLDYGGHSQTYYAGSFSSGDFSAHRSMARPTSSLV